MMLNELPANAPHAARALGLVVHLPDLAGVLVTTVIFTLFGLLVFGLAYTVIVKATPFSIRKEIEEDQNVALAIVIGAVIIGISLIIAAAIQG
jgi:putative membrane protein